jgi:hypothetical protein
MAMVRRNLVFTDENYQWVRQHACSERALSRLINDILQKERALGPIETKLAQHVAQLDRLPAFKPDAL